MGDLAERAINPRDRRRSARSSTRRRSRRSTRADFRRPRRRSQPGVRSVAATADFVRRDGRPLGRSGSTRTATSTRRRPPTAATCTACRSRRCSGRAGRAVADGGLPKVRPEHTVLIGIRNLDAREKESLSASGAHVFTMKDIDRSGIASIVEQALAIAGAGTAGIHVSFDLDVCDPSIAPGVGTPVKGTTIARRTW